MIPLAAHVESHGVYFWMIGVIVLVVVLAGLEAAREEMADRRMRRRVVRALATGAISPNEARRMLGLPPLDEERFR